MVDALSVPCRAWSLDVLAYMMSKTVKNLLEFVVSSLFSHFLFFKEMKAVLDHQSYSYVLASFFFFSAREWGERRG